MAPKKKRKRKKLHANHFSKPLLTLLFSQHNYSHTCAFLEFLEKAVKV